MTPESDRNIHRAFLIAGILFFLICLGITVHKMMAPRHVNLCRGTSSLYASGWALDGKRWCIRQNLSPPPGATGGTCTSWDDLGCTELIQCYDSEKDAVEMCDFGYIKGTTTEEIP